MLAIYKRELKSFFHSFVGWLFLAVTFFMMGIYFTVYNMLSGYPTISYVLQSVIFLFIITIPILTMRTLAEDRKYKTDQLILTAPVSVGKIVAGKYLALVTVLAIPTVAIGLTPLALMQVGEFQTGISYTALLGFFLYGCLGLAIGLFVSSLTESVVIAAVLTLVLLFVGYIMTGLCSIISTSGTGTFSEIVAKILGAFDMVSPFDQLCTGYFNLTAVIYYVTFTLFMLFVTSQSIQKRRYSVSGKGIKLGAYSITSILVLAVLTVVVNVGVAQIPEQYVSYDVTANKIYSLTDETKEMLEGIDKDVTIYVLADESEKDADLDNTLQQAAGLSKHITVTYVSPTSNPKFYYNYTQEEPTTNSLIVTTDSNSVVVDYNNIYSYSMNYSTYEYEVTGYDGEGQLAAAVSSVLAEKIPKYYIIEGHGELAFEDTFNSAMTKENVQYELLSLYSVDAIPEDADAIIINAPTSDFSQDDVDKVIAFLEQGGNALLIPTWTEEALPNFEQILAYYGVSMIDGMIVELDKNYYYAGSPYYLIPTIEYDETTKRIQNLNVFAPFSRGLSYDQDSEEDISYTPLLETSSESFSKTDISNTQDYTKMDGDAQGPFVIALKARKTTSQQAGSEAVIVATESMFTNDADVMFPGNNQKFFCNIISYLTEQELSTAIPAKSFDIGYLAFNARVSIVTGVIAILLLPVGCLIIGLVIWLTRRRK